MPTVAEAQKLVLTEIGAGLEGLPDEILAQILDKVTPLISIVWEQWLWKAQIWPTLQGLYVKRQCLDILMGQTRDLTQVSIGSANITQGQLFTNLGTLRTNTCTEIERIEKMAEASRPVAIGVMNNPAIAQDYHGRVYMPGARTNYPFLPPGGNGSGW